MNKVDGVSVISGMLAMAVTGTGAMAVGYGGMSFDSPWPSLVVIGICVEAGLMRWVGPVPAVLLTGPLFALARRNPRLEPWAERVLYVLISLTSVSLALLLLRLGARRA
jgi:hypothetical protein